MVLKLCKENYQNSFKTIRELSISWSDEVSKYCWLITKDKNNIGLNYLMNFKEYVFTKRIYHILRIIQSPFRISPCCHVNQSL